MYLVCYATLYCVDFIKMLRVKLWAIAMVVDGLNKIMGFVNYNNAVAQNAPELILEHSICKKFSWVSTP